MGKSKLANGSYHPISFPKLLVVHKREDDEENGYNEELRPSDKEMNSLQVIEMRYCKMFLSNHQEVIERDLIINVILSIGAFYLGNNAIDEFSVNQDGKSHLKTILAKRGHTYYTTSISLLRSIISKHKFSVELSIIVSLLLHKISIYEFEDINNSIIFSRGLFDILDSLVIKDFQHDKPKDINVVINFLSFASKSLYFPCYTYKVLYEYRSMLYQFASFIQYPTGMKVKFNNLNMFINDLITLCQDNISEDGYMGNSGLINRDPLVVYRLLRRWLSILPPAVSILNDVTDEIEAVLLKFYNLLSLMMNNIFPALNFFFLSSFTGRLVYFRDAVYKHEPKTYHRTELTPFDTYCHRLSTFFSKRLNLLSIYSGKQKFNNLNEVSSKEIVKGFNEVMIESFNNVNIRLLNYLHFAGKVNFASKKKDIKNHQEFRQRMMEMAPNLFRYNKHHEENFINGNVFSNWIYNDEFDPVLNFSINFISGGNDFRIDRDRVDYSLTLPKIQSETIRAGINDSYFKLFNGDYDNDIQINELDCNNGLLKSDTDILLMAVLPILYYKTISYNTIEEFLVNDFDEFKTVQTEILSPYFDIG